MTIFIRINHVPCIFGKYASGILTHIFVIYYMLHHSCTLLVRHYVSFIFPCTLLVCSTRYLLGDTRPGRVCSRFVFCSICIVIFACCFWGVVDQWAYVILPLVICYLFRNFSWVVCLFFFLWCFILCSCYMTVRSFYLFIAFVYPPLEFLLPLRYLVPPFLGFHLIISL